MCSQSNQIRSVIYTEEHFSVSASISDANFWKIKICKSFSNFYFRKIAPEIDAKTLKCSSVSITDIIRFDCEHIISKGFFIIFYITIIIIYFYIFIINPVL